MTVEIDAAPGTAITRGKEIGPLPRVAIAVEKAIASPKIGPVAAARAPPTQGPARAMSLVIGDKNLPMRRRGRMWM